jgi:hypothetical protein
MHPGFQLRQYGKRLATRRTYVVNALLRDFSAVDKRDALAGASRPSGMAGDRAEDKQVGGAGGGHHGSRSALFVGSTG